MSQKCCKMMINLSSSAVPLKKPQTQRPSWSGSETCLPLPCSASCNKPLLCYKHLLPEFGFLRCGHTSPCSVTLKLWNEASVFSASLEFNLFIDVEGSPF